MVFGAVFIIGFVFFCGICLAQGFFIRLNGRPFWRAMVSEEIRQTVFPRDPVKMDQFMFLEEWAAVLFLGAFLCLPLIMLNVMGVIDIFP